MYQYAPCPSFRGRCTTISPHDTPPQPLSYSEALHRLLYAPDAPAPAPIWLDAFERFGAALDSSAFDRSAFLDAWRTLYSATLILDHLQDDDFISDVWFAALSRPLQYHLAFGAYVAAEEALFALISTGGSDVRWLHLQRVWRDSIAQLAAGQYADLTQRVQSAASNAVLDRYETIARQKTGASFALAFGGMAILGGTAAAQVTAAINVGLLFGMLLQYSDDLHDAQDQELQPATLTLQRALGELIAPEGAPAPAPTVIWAAIYAETVRSLETLMEPLPEAAQQVVWELLTSIYGALPVIEATGPRRTEAT